MTVQLVCPVELWVHHARQIFRPHHQDGDLTSSEREEWARLRRENRRLREDVASAGKEHLIQAPDKPSFCPFRPRASPPLLR